MIGRVTQGTLTRELQSSTARLQARLAAAQAQISSGKRVINPGDDPNATARIERLRATASELGAFRNGVGFARAVLGAADGALEQAETVLVRAREIATAHAGGLTTPASRQAAAEEVEELEQELIALGNTTIGGRYVFGGLASGTPPFVTFGIPGFDPATAYTGTTTPFEIAVARDHSVEIGTPGEATFEAALAAVDDLRTTLAAGNAPSASLDALDDAAEVVRQARASVGGRAGRLEARDQEIGTQLEQARKLLGETEDADLTQSVAELVQLQHALEATLAAGTRLLQMSILDFVRF